MSRLGRTITKLASALLIIKCLDTTGPILENKIESIIHPRAVASETICNKTPARKTACNKGFLTPDTLIYYKAQRNSEGIDCLGIIAEKFYNPNSGLSFGAYQAEIAKINPQMKKYNVIEGNKYRIPLYRDRAPGDR